MAFVAAMANVTSTATVAVTGGSSSDSQGNSISKGGSKSYIAYDGQEHQRATAAATAMAAVT